MLLKKEKIALKVIIADDHELFRQGLESLLKKIPGITKVSHAANGKEVLSLLEKDSFNLIFMDIRMPLMNGIEATSKVKAEYPATEVIALTMMEDRFNIVNMFKAGASGYLLKNINFHELEEAIVQVFRGEKYYSRKISEVLLGEIVNTKANKNSRQYKEELTDRENEIVRLICMSFTSKEISEILNLSEKTIETHRVNIYSKLEIDNIVDLVFYAIDLGLVDRPED